MTATTSLLVVTSTIASVQSNFTTVLPVLLPFVVTVLVLYFAWRRIHSLL